MKSRRIQVWKLVDAPLKLRMLHNRSMATEGWVALIPREIDGMDLCDVMAPSARAESISRYEIPSGDIVYIGTAQHAAVLAVGHTDGLLGQATASAPVTSISPGPIPAITLHAAKFTL